MYGIVVVSLFYVFHLYFDDTQYAFHKPEGPKTGVFLSHIFDSKGSGLSKVSTVMSSQQTARTANTINILQDKLYILSQEKNATRKHSSPAIPLC